MLCRKERKMPSKQLKKKYISVYTQVKVTEEDLYLVL